MRSTIPLIISLVVGLLMVGEFFIPHWRYHLLTENLLEWGVIVSAGAFLLGLINLIQVNLPKILERQEDWQYKVVMLVGLVVTLIAGFSGGAQRISDGFAYRWIYDYILTPLNATMFALLAFYIASAAFRAFRARNLDATVLLSAAIIVMIARVPAGELLGQTISGAISGLLGDWTLIFLPENFLSQFMNWLMDVPNIAARRAIFIGAALGAIATGLRIILGIERSHLGAD
ncbi:MAG: hypothetical protein ACI8RZ_005052 [Myxococcota bacterium]|jgi:hypothetical protein